MKGAPRIGLLLLLLACLATPSQAFELYLEAEDGEVVPPMRIRPDRSASNGSYVSSDVEEHGTVVLPFEVPGPGDLDIWLRVLTPTPGEDAIRFTVGGRKPGRFFTSRSMTGYEWFRLHDRREPFTASLSAGSHTLKFTGAEAGFRLDRIFLTDDPTAMPVGYVPPESCTDATRNQDESDVDCGGFACPRCAAMRACARPGDCASGACVDEVCRAPSCSDEMRNGEEAGIDCGGGCEALCTPPALSGLLPLIGDPTFDPAQLSPEMRRWYDRALKSMRRSRRHIDEKAASGNLFSLGRYVNEHTSSLLMALRATGDLQFLDRAVELWDTAQESLQDAWCDGTTDGYVNWLWREGRSSTTHHCKDIHAMDEAMTHGGLAALVYALDLNRRLDPRYGARADFWLDYLENHFLAKWYARGAARGCTEVDVWEVQDCGFYKRLTHPRMNQLRLAYALWRVTGDEFYLERATVIAADLLSKVEANPGAAEAYLWKHQISGNDEGYQKINYAQYYMRGVHEMYLEQFEGFAQDAVMEGYMSTFRDVVFDRERFGKSPAAMADRVDGTGKRTFEMYALGGFARWDPTGFLQELASRSYTPGPAGMDLAAGALLTLSERGAGSP